MYFKVINKLGPGILMASAAIGVSHLVQSTRAGVYYGFAAIFVVLLANFMKYPFYEYGHRYAASTGNNLLDGYKKLGKPYLWSFLLINIFTAVGSIAAISFITAALLQYLVLPELSLAVIAGFVLLLSWAILMIGHYKWLENTSKVLMVILCITTAIAAFIGLISPKTVVEATPQKILTLESLPFLLALMGWMPASSEVTVWQSLWVQAEARSRGHAISNKDALFDFNTGYILIAVLACLFIVIGATTLQGQVLSDKPAEFAGQFVTMYGSLIGNWAIPIVGVCAVAAMFSTVFAVVDAYPRSLSTSLKTLYPEWPVAEHFLRHTITGIILIAAVLLIGQYANSLKKLVDVVTIFASLAMPWFAWLNMRCVRSIENQPPKWVKQLAVVGLVYLLFISGLFIFSKMT